MLLNTMNGKKYKVGYLHTLCFLLFVAPFLAQTQNLVPNPSFEQLDACPYATGFVVGDRPLLWYSWLNSPEYFHNCALPPVDTLVNVPQNGFAYQQAFEGNAYVGMYAFGTSGGGINPYREYVGCELTEPMEVGGTYDLSFYTNVAIDGNYWYTSTACNNMGMLFTMQPNFWFEIPGPSFALRNYAHLHSLEVITDTANWTLVSSSFVADSAYQYLVLGNFFGQVQTDTVNLDQEPSLGAYYFVDAVCVTRAGNDCSFTSDVQEQESNVNLPWPNPADGFMNITVEPGLDWRVYNAVGQLMAKGISRSSELTIPVYRWAEGDYLLRLQGNELKHFRFVVMH